MGNVFREPQMCVFMRVSSEIPQEAFFCPVNSEVTDTMVIQDLNEVGNKGQPYQIVYYSLPLYTPL